MSRMQGTSFPLVGEPYVMTVYEGSWLAQLVS